MNLLVWNDGAPSGEDNMARDAWLLAEAERLGRPLLRLYGWERPTLSLGRAQRLERELNLEVLAQDHIPLVRRMTGGRAVLHGHDITYALAAPEGTYGGLMDCYRLTAGALLAWLKALGVPASSQPFTRAEQTGGANANCFAAPSACEIVVHGKKLAGSAQRRRAGAWLQHGSIPLRVNTSQMAALFTGETPASIQAAMASLEELGLTDRFSTEALRQGLIQAFVEALGAEAAEPLLTPPDLLARLAQDASAYRVVPAGISSGSVPGQPPTARR
ncbi:MAG: lipoate--protein ligase family protein [Deltaproteobacteria bacterium]|nr:lipoate--protein ligase family protein [Deltaproteobacteria bacterium]